MEKKEEPIKVIGYVGSKHQYHLNDETKKSVISFSLKPEDGDWIRVKAFTENAELIKNAIENEGIKKLSVTGKMRDGQPYMNDKGETVNYKELIVDEVTRFRPVEIHGVIAKVEEKQTSKQTPYEHVFIKNTIQLGETSKTENHNVNIFSGTKKNIPVDVELKVGQPLAVKGEAAISIYKDKDNNKRESVTITAWNVDKSPTRLREQVKQAQANALEKSEKVEEQSRSHKVSKAPAKDQGISM